MGREYCFFTAHFLPSYGGVEKYTYELAKQLIDRGYRVTVVTSQLEGMKERENIDGIDVLRLPCFKLLNGRFPVYSPGGKARERLKALDELHFDFLVVQTRFYPHSLVGVRYAHKRKIPCIVIEHGSAHNTVNNAFMDKIGAGFEHAITKGVKHYCKDFYGVSSACCKWLEHFGIHAKGTLNNAVDVQAFRPMEGKTTADGREERSGSLEVFFAGRLVYDKGILQLVDAVRRLNKEGLSVKLSIAGDGNLFEQLRGQATKEIIVLGRLNREQMLERYRMSDVFCLPSDHEGFSTTILEAAASKCFIITTDTGGAKELLPCDGFGIVMDNNTTEDIMEAIKKAAQDPQYRKEAVEKAYSQVVQHYTWEKICDQLIDIEETMNATR